MGRFVRIRKSEANSDEEEDDEDEDDEEEGDEDEVDNILEDELEEEEVEEEDEEEEIEEEFPDARSWLPHPKPFESLRAFYSRTGAQFWNGLFQVIEMLVVRI